jgi:diguanylate cyclase (GGDEF)-like protein
VENKNAKDKLGGIVPTESRAIAKSSASLMGRGLRSLSGWDSARVIEVGKTLTSTLQLDQVLSKLMDNINEWMHPDTWSLLLVDEVKQELYFELAVGEGAQALRDVRMKMGEGIAGWVAQNAEAVIVPDISQDTRFFSNADEKTRTQARSVVAVPLRHNDRCLGVIELVYGVGNGDLSQANLSLLQALADFAAIALENARHFKRLHELTITEDRTGLYNIRHMDFILESEIWRSEQYGYDFALIFVDVGQRKDLASSLGYPRFNKLLAELGQMFKAAARRIDFAFYNAEGEFAEFALVLPQASMESVCTVARRLHRLIRETAWLTQGKESLRLTASIGVASYPTDARTKIDLLHRADEALYLVRSSTGDGVAVANIGILPPLE